jgi:hypothetical protein
VQVIEKFNRAGISVFFFRPLVTRTLIVRKYYVHGLLFYLPSHLRGPISCRCSLEQERPFPCLRTVKAKGKGTVEEAIIAEGKKGQGHREKLSFSA